MKTIYLLVFTVFALAACKRGGASDGELGTIIKKEIDGCTWLIQLANDELLQPTNLNEFNVTLKDGQPVKLTYEASTNAMSICMMGKMVNLKSIRDR